MVQEQHGTRTRADRGTRRCGRILTRIAVISFVACLLAGAASLRAGAAVAAPAHPAAATATTAGIRSNAAPAAAEPGGSCSAYQRGDEIVINGSLFRCAYFPGVGYFWIWVAFVGTGPGCPNGVSVSVARLAGASPGARTCN